MKPMKEAEVQAMEGQAVNRKQIIPVAKQEAIAVQTVAGPVSNIKELAGLVLKLVGVEMRMKEVEEGKNIQANVAVQATEAPMSNIKEQAGLVLKLVGVEMRMKEVEEGKNIQANVAVQAVEAPMSNIK